MRVWIVVFVFGQVVFSAHGVDNALLVRTKNVFPFGMPREKQAIFLFLNLLKLSCSLCGTSHLEVSVLVRVSSDCDLCKHMKMRALDHSRSRHASACDSQSHVNLHGTCSLRITAHQLTQTYITTSESSSTL